MFFFVMEKMSSRVFAFSAVLAVVTSCGDFYWRDYDGVIPADAIPAGIGSDNQVLYIGHAYLHGYGLLMGTIKRGRREITIPCYGVKRTNKRIKILCAERHSRFYWASVTTNTIKDYLKDKCPVVGGWDAKAEENGFKDEGILYIGRKKHQDELIIGNVAAYSIEKSGIAYMYFPYDNQEHRATEFDMLMFSEKPSKEGNRVDEIYNLDVIPVDDRK